MESNHPTVGCHGLLVWFGSRRSVILSPQSRCGFGMVSGQVDGLACRQDKRACVRPAPNYLSGGLSGSPASSETRPPSLAGSGLVEPVSLFDRGDGVQSPERIKPDERNRVGKEVDGETYSPI
jgi:hypothetical protein